MQRAAVLFKGKGEQGAGVDHRGTQQVKPAVLKLLAAVQT
jgi:hypothetical protein